MLDVLPARTDPTNSPIVAAWRARAPGSARLAAEAAELLPSGIAHDARRLEPFGPYIARAAGAHKWDVDGNRYVDFYGGHGALLLGHAPPPITEAVAAALAEGTQFGACHPREIGWARAIHRLVPSAERIRFTSSGTEATLMAVRLARAATGRRGLIRFRGHFHGWHDHMTSGYQDHFDGSATTGVLPGVAERVILLPAGDEAALEAALEADPDIAAAIIEPTGASFGQIPLRPEFLHALRRLTAAHGVLLIMDEVVTGFRVSPGGAQAALGIRPDLSSFAKIVAGGLPGAAVAGRRDVMDRLDFAAAERSGQEKINHPGTFNANPVSAAAGIAMLGILAGTDANARAAATAAALRHALNEAFARAGVGWAAYGTSSGFHVFLDPAGRGVDPLRFDPHAVAFQELKAAPPLAGRLRLALLLHGVDTSNRIGGFTSAAHGPADVDEAAAAFTGAIRMLRAEGELA